CQAHHLIPWEAGGATEERNLALTCNHHHKMVHEHGYQLRWNTTGTTIETIRPDGTTIHI
ncbi:MAG: HNH endonuclease signature motif containing protein, partial [Propionicimonas sp.]